MYSSRTRLPPCKDALFLLKLSDSHSLFFALGDTYSMKGDITMRLHVLERHLSRGVLLGISAGRSVLPTLLLLIVVVQPTQAEEIRFVASIDSIGSPGGKPVVEPP